VKAEIFRQELRIFLIWTVLSTILSLKVRQLQEKSFAINKVFLYKCSVPFGKRYDFCSFH